MFRVGEKIVLFLCLLDMSQFDRHISVLEMTGLLTDGNILNLHVER